MALVDTSTSRFTAVNSAKELTPIPGSAVLTDGNTSHVPKSEPDKRPVSQSRPSPHGQEKLTLVTSSTNQKEDRACSTSGDQNTPQLSNSHIEIEKTHKRKRSNPKYITPFLNNSASSSSRNVPGGMPTETDLACEENFRQHVQVDPRETYPLETQFTKYPTPSEEHQSIQDVEQWKIRHFSQSTHLTSDAQHSEVLQQTSHEPNTHNRQHSNRKTNHQSETKKRKRNFSNRTKTGCMTCRKRKKKCDETKPECNNCLRGGFVCTGYQQRGSLSKHEQNSLPLPLQSKSDYQNSPYPVSGQYITPTSKAGQSREPLPGYRGQSLRVDSQQSHIFVVGDNHANVSCYHPITLSTFEASSETSLSTLPTPQQMPTPVTATNSAYPDRHLKNIFDRVVSPDDLNRQEPRIEPGMVKSQLVSSSSIPHVLQSPINVEPYKNPQIAAQLALSNLASAGNPCPSKEDFAGQPTQKEEMLSGRHYFPMDKQLILERENCKGACWRFNSSSNPNIGVSPDERSRLFRDILHPRLVGDNVIVDAPFHCDYGYNIIIGQDVMIDRNCTIIDTCEVRIGDRCHIGPNVNIYTTSLPIDPKKRLGAKGPHLGKKVIIESDCWIGGGAIILPGRTIGKGATVGAGSVVTKDIPPYTVARGNPAHILRGVSDPE